MPCIRLAPQVGRVLARGGDHVTRQILGYRKQQTSSESSFTLIATIQ